MYVLERGERAGVRRHVVGPETLDRGQVIVRDGAAAIERHTKRLELLLRPADAHPENEAAAAQSVHGRGHARGLDWVTIREDDHRASELDPASGGREPAERGERVVDRRRISGRDI